MARQYGGLSAGLMLVRAWETIGLAMSAFVLNGHVHSALLGVVSLGKPLGLLDYWVTFCARKQVSRGCCLRRDVQAVAGN